MAILPNRRLCFIAVCSLNASLMKINMSASESLVSPYFGVGRTIQQGYCTVSNCRCHPLRITVF